MRRLIVAALLALISITVAVPWLAASAQTSPQGVANMPTQLSWNAWGWDRTADPAHNDYEILMVNYPPISVPPSDAAQVSAPLPWVLAGDDPNNPQWSVVYSFPTQADAAADPNFAPYFQ